MVATTFQAVSGAGRGGPSHLELADNVFPVIPGEEEKDSGSSPQVTDSTSAEKTTAAPDKEKTQ